MYVKRGWEVACERGNMLYAWVHKVVCFYVLYIRYFTLLTLVLYPARNYVICIKYNSVLLVLYSIPLFY